MSERKFSFSDGVGVAFYDTCEGAAARLGIDASELKPSCDAAWEGVEGLIDCRVCGMTIGAIRHDR